MAKRKAPLAVDPEDVDLPDPTEVEDPPEVEEEDGDARLVRGHDSRTRKASDSQRRSRAEEDVGRTGDDGLAMTREEQRRLFRDEWTQDALPQVPTMPGYHLCWLTTTNTHDPVQRRLRVGYELVRADEVPGFGHLKLHSGEYAGVVSINEMILAKVPMRIYQAMMSEWHHEQPREAEETIKNNAKALAERDDMQDSDGKPLVQLEPGMEQLGKSRPAPKFTGLFLIH